MCMMNEIMSKNWTMENGQWIINCKNCGTVSELLTLSAAKERSSIAKAYAKLSINNAGHSVEKL